MFTIFGDFSNLPKKKVLKAKVFTGCSNRFVVFILFMCDSFGLASLTAQVPCVWVLNDPASFCVRRLAFEQVEQVMETALSGS